MIEHTSIRIPAEWEPHECCWMAWAVHREWDKTAARKIKRELSQVIQTIARYEPVRVLAPRGAHLREARREFAECPNVTVIEAPVDDFWMRDIAPTFAWRGAGAAQEIVAIDWNFNGWGGTRDRPSRPGDRLAKHAAAIFGVPRISARFVAEGGALVTDGQGTMITTRSCLLNPNRNPVRRGVDRQHMIEAELARFGIRRVIWLEGDPCEPITSGHTDGYVLCAPNGVVLVETVDDPDAETPFWRGHDIALLENARDTAGRKLKLVRVLAPRRRYWKPKSDFFAPCYLNAYVANGAVIGARFGDDERDAAARKALAKAFQGREIITLQIDATANAGGGIHCLTQSMPSSSFRESKMAIGNAVQRGSSVYIYDEKGRQLGSVSAGSGKEDGLKGYTSTTVNIRRGNTIYTYNEKGRQNRLVESTSMSTSGGSVCIFRGSIIHTIIKSRSPAKHVYSSSAQPHRPDSLTSLVGGERTSTSIFSTVLKTITCGCFLTISQSAGADKNSLRTNFLLKNVAPSRVSLAAK